MLLIFALVIALPIAVIALAIYFYMKNRKAEEDLDRKMQRQPANNK